MGIIRYPHARMRVRQIHRQRESLPRSQQSTCIGLDTNVRHKTVKHLEENRRNIYNLLLHKDFLTKKKTKQETNIKT